MTARLEKLATVDAPPFNEALASLQDELERDMPNGLEDAPAWAKRALDRVTNWIGTSGEETGANSYLQSRVTRSLNQAVLDTANEFTNRLNEYAIQLMEMPGKRIAATEAALYRMAQFCAQLADGLARQIPELAQKTTVAWTDVKIDLRSLPERQRLPAIRQPHPAQFANAARRSCGIRQGQAERTTRWRDRPPLSHGSQWTGRKAPQT